MTVLPDEVERGLALLEEAFHKARDGAVLVVEATLAERVKPHPDQQWAAQLTHIADELVVDLIRLENRIRARAREEQAVRESLWVADAIRDALTKYRDAVAATLTRKGGHDGESQQHDGH